MNMAIVNGPGMWLIFGILVVFLLALDLFVFHRHAHEIKFKEAMALSIFWIAVSLLFDAGLYFHEGPKRAMEFLAGYLIEKSLSVDNLFVFLVIFSYFKIESKYQHKILFWGIVGALVMRAFFILTGVALIQRFSWMDYIFGGFLVFTGIKLAVSGENQVDPGKNRVLKFMRRVLPISEHHPDGKFFVKEAARWMVTPLFLVLIVVETTDLLFAVDSIPAVLAVSKDPFIVFSSNVFAILGLRALYFALAGIMKMFHYLKYGLAVVLVFVGVKMLIEHIYRIPIGASLAVVGGILGVSVIVSFLFPEREKI